LAIDVEKTNTWLCCGMKPPIGPPSMTAGWPGRPGAPATAPGGGPPCTDDVAGPLLAYGSLPAAAAADGGWCAGGIEDDGGGAGAKLSRSADDGGGALPGPDDDNALAGSPSTHTPDNTLSLNNNTIN